MKKQTVFRVLTAIALMLAISFSAYAQPKGIVLPIQLYVGIQSGTQPSGEAKYVVVSGCAVRWCNNQAEFDSDAEFSIEWFSDPAGTNPLSATITRSLSASFMSNKKVSPDMRILTLKPHQNKNITTAGTYFFRVKVKTKTNKGQSNVRSFIVEPKAPPAPAIDTKYGKMEQLQRYEAPPFIAILAKKNNGFVHGKSNFGSTAEYTLYTSSFLYIDEKNLSLLWYDQYDNPISAPREGIGKVSVTDVKAFIYTLSIEIGTNLPLGRFYFRVKDSNGDRVLVSSNVGFILNEDYIY